MSSDVLNYTVAFFFAVLVIGLVIVLKRLYEVLGESEKVLKNTEELTANAAEASADVKEMTNDVKERIVKPLAGSVIIDLIAGFLEKIKLRKRRKQ